MRTYRKIAIMAVVYILEAHFVERDEKGRIQNGWPIGYTDCEYPQHHSLKDRIRMAKTASKQMHCLTDADVICTDSWSNDFNNFFAAWPDQLYAIDQQGMIIFQGQMSTSRPGTRDSSFSTQLEVFLRERGDI